MTDVSESTLFENFFESGMEESVSPFLTPDSRQWGKNLALKVSIFSGSLLLGAYLFSFFPSLIFLSHILLCLTYFCAGIPALITSLEDLIRFEINIEVLMTLAAFGSFVIGSEKEGALLLVLFAISGAMEESVTSKAKKALFEIKRLVPSKTHVVSEDGSFIERSIKDIKAGTKIHVKAGEMIPLDGKIIQGSSSINLMHLTGENLPLLKQTGDEVLSGGIALDGAITLLVTTTSINSTLSQILRLMIQATQSKPKLERWLDKISKGYSITIILAFLALALLLPLFFSIPYLGFQGSIYRSLTFLIAASPCALIIAIPIAYLSAISACTKKGILLKGGAILDTITKCRAIAFDKTGTLTHGELDFLGIEAEPSFQHEYLLAIAIAASLEKNVVHPVAHAIMTYAKKHNISCNEPIRDFTTIPGFGIKAYFQEEEVLLGRPEWILQTLPVSLQTTIKEKIISFQEHGELLTLLKKGSGIFYLRFKDILRPNIKHILNHLKNAYNYSFYMLTGDHALNAQIIGNEAGIHNIHSSLHPKDKLDIIEKISSKTPLMMVGDGVNDAPALAKANVGIAMGKMGQGIATHAADVILLHDNVEHLPFLIKKSFTTQKIVKQNLFLSCSVILFATLPALFGTIPLWIAVLLHEGGTVLVGLNSLRLLRNEV